MDPLLEKDAFMNFKSSENDQVLDIKLGRISPWQKVLWVRPATDLGNASFWKRLSAGSIESHFPSAAPAYLLPQVFVQVRPPVVGEVAKCTCFSFRARATPGHVDARPPAKVWMTTAAFALDDHCLDDHSGGWKLLPWTQL